MNELIVLVGGGFVGGLLIGWLAGNNKPGCILAGALPIGAAIYANYVLQLADPADLNSTSAVIMGLWPIYASASGVIGFFLGDGLRTRTGK